MTAVLEETGYDWRSLWDHYDGRQREIDDLEFEPDLQQAGPHAHVTSPDKAYSPRAKRRRIKRRNIRGVRPDITLESPTGTANATPWWRRSKKARPKHPRYRMTKVEMAPDEDGTLVPVVRRGCSKPVPNRRRDYVPSTELDEEQEAPTKPPPTACTLYGSVPEGGSIVVMSTPAGPLAHVILPWSVTDEGPPILTELSDDPDAVDPEIAEIFGDDSGITAEFGCGCPDGFCIENERGWLVSSSVTSTTQLLAAAAVIEPDFDDPERDPLQSEPRHLVARA